MSLLETNKPSVQNPKDLTNNIVDSSNPINDIASGTWVHTLKMGYNVK